MPRGFGFGAQDLFDTNEKCLKGNKECFTVGVDVVYVYLCKKAFNLSFYRQFDSSYLFFT